jgi:hypothetical protein
VAHARSLRQTPPVGVFEVTLRYDGSYDEHRSFLASLARAPNAPIDGFRRRREGFDVVVVVETNLGAEFALRVATQQAAGALPNLSPGSTVLVWKV